VSLDVKEVIRGVFGGLGAYEHAKARMLVAILTVLPTE